LTKTEKTEADRGDSLKRDVARADMTTHDRVVFAEERGGWKELTKEAEQMIWPHPAME